MTYQLSNPFVRRTKFQFMHSSIPSTLSSSYTIGPNTSICPKKKYSKNQWYDYQSSHLQLSQKIIFRMNAEFYRLQSLQIKDPDQLQHGSCLLHTEVKKNPFERRNLLNQEGLYHINKPKNETDWTEQQSKVKFSGPEAIRNYTETMKQYGLMKRKIQEIKSDKIVSNNSLFDTKSRNKMTFGAEQKFIPSLQLYGKQKNSSGKDFSESYKSSKQFLGNVKMTQSLSNLQTVPHKINLLQSTKFETIEPKSSPVESSPTESNKQLKLKQSHETFALKRNSTKQLLSQKIKYKNVTYYLVPLKKEIR